MSFLTILHTGDLHNNMSDYAETVIEKEYLKNENVMLLDAGDAVRSGNITYNVSGERILKKMSFLKYDAMTMGNREFHFSSYGLNKKLYLSEFPVLSANFKSDRTFPNNRIVPYIIKQIGDVRIGILGLTVPMITKKMFVSKFSPFYFDDPIETAKNVTAEMKNKCDFIIALTHLGIEKDNCIADEIDDIDLIIGGHSHTDMNDVIVVNNKYISHAGCKGEFISRLDLEISDSKIKSIARKKINLFL